MILSQSSIPQKGQVDPGQTKVQYAAESIFA
jgi:hypothetical protein